MSQESPRKLGNLSCPSRVDLLSRTAVAGIDRGSGIYTFDVDGDQLTPPTTAGVIGALNPSPCGQNIVYSAAATAVGRDYLGQVVTETIAAPGAGAKAFVRIDSLSAGTFTWGEEYGVPYAGASDADAGGAITAADATDPSTATDGDVRGTVNYTVNPDGATDKTFSYTTSAGNLHGVANA